jgi:hypothetical protein
MGEADGGARHRAVLVAHGSLLWWCWFNLSFGVASCGQGGGGELRCIRRNPASALSVPTMA